MTFRFQDLDQELAIPITAFFVGVAALLFVFGMAGRASRKVNGPRLSFFVGSSLFWGVELLGISLTAGILASAYRVGDNRVFYVALFIPVVITLLAVLCAAMAFATLSIVPATRTAVLSEERLKIISTRRNLACTLIGSVLAVTGYVF